MRISWLALLLALPAAAQSGGFRTECLPELKLTSRHVLDLARAMPAEKYRQDLRLDRQAFPKANFENPVRFFGRDVTARAIYLRILAHVNEHYGQSIAYARMNGVVPPWSK